MAAVNVTFPGNLAQVKTAADLRSVPSTLLPLGALFLVNGLEGLFEYDPGSLAADDGKDVLRPADKTPGQVGRWIRNVDGLATGPEGPTGPANSTYTSLVALKAAPQSNRSYILADGTNSPVTYAYVAGDFTGRADDVNVVKLDAVPLTTGALVRQAADSIGYTSNFVPAPTRPVNRVLDDFPTLPSLGVTETNTPEANASKLAEITEKARSLAINTANPPRIRIPRGVYPHTGRTPGGAVINFAAQGMTYDAEPGAVLYHTGTGPAFMCDGGETGGGIGMMKVLNGLVIRGNANTTDGMVNRAVHHSTFDVEVQNVSVAALRTNWAVCNEYWFRYNPLFRPAFNPVAQIGAFLSRRATGERTSACVFHNTIIGGVNGYAMNFDDAIANKLILGTLETSVGGLFMGPNAISNDIDGMDIEFNTSIDIFCQGVYNRISPRFADNLIQIEGLLNQYKGGMCNDLRSNGSFNDFEFTNYGIAGGNFVDTGSNTSWRGMRNATSGQLLADKFGNAIGSMLIGKPGSALVMGRADMVDGGSADAVALAIQGAALAYIRSNVGARVGWSNDGLGFFDKSMSPVPKQNIAGSRSNNAALASLISGLSALGLIIDSTTA